MKRPIPLLLLIVLAPAQGRAADYTAEVVGISDGDTLTVLKADRKQVKIRLHGIDAPESGQDFGKRAKQTASELAFGKAVTILPHDIDRYGRTVADVILPDGRSLNQEMVREGYAWWSREYAPRDRDLERLESQAKAALPGILGPAWPDTAPGLAKGQGRAGDGGGDRQPQEPRLPFAALPWRCRHEGREPRRVRDGGGGRGGGVSEGGGLSVGDRGGDPDLPRKGVGLRPRTRQGRYRPVRSRSGRSARTVPRRYDPRGTVFAARF
jgi:endonuclease YncB( thermonuclease family)